MALLDVEDSSSEDGSCSDACGTSRCGFGHGQLPSNCLDLTAPSGPCTPCPSTPQSACSNTAPWGERPPSTAGSAAGSAQQRAPQLFCRNRIMSGALDSHPGTPAFTPPDSAASNASHATDVSRPSIGSTASTRPCSAAFQQPAAGPTLAGSLRPAQLRQLSSLLPSEAGSPPSTSISAPAAMQRPETASDDPLDRLQRLRGNLPAFGRRSGDRAGFGSSHLATLASLSSGVSRTELLEPTRGVSPRPGAQPQELSTLEELRVARAAAAAAVAARRLQRSANLNDAYGGTPQPQASPGRAAQQRGAHGAHGAHGGATRARPEALRSDLAEVRAESSGAPSRALWAPPSTPTARGEPPAEARAQWAPPGAPTARGEPPAAASPLGLAHW